MCIYCGCQCLLVMISRPTPLHVLSKYRPVSTSLNRTMPPSKQKQDGHFWSHSNHMKIHINHVQIIIRPLFLCGSKNIFFPFFKSYCVKSVELNPMTQMANICLLSLFQHTLVCLNLSVDECCVTLPFLGGSVCWDNPNEHFTIGRLSQPFG